MFRGISIFVLLTASLLGQSADIPGWLDLKWGATNAVALSTLRALGIHECNRTGNVSCAEAAGTDVLVIEKYTFVKIPFRVHLLLTSKGGFHKAIMTCEDRRDAFEKVLSELTARYGKPGFQSEYDGDAEETRTTWIWSKAHGKLSLEADEARGIVTVIYELR
jgi:hypothetical protein